MSGRRVLPSVAALTCVCSVWIGTVAASRSLGTRGPRAAAGQSRPASPTTASNRRAAVLDAKELLAGVVPPAGGVLRSSGARTGTRAPLLTTAFASAVAYSTWTVRADPASVLSSVEAHLPRGSKLVSTGSGGNPRSQSVIRSWPAVEGVLDVRWLEVEVTAHAGGTLLYAESQSQWIVTRPKGERIPPHVREVDVSSGWPGKPPFLSRRVTSRAKVNALVTLFDSLQIIQPGAINCPAETVSPTVVLAFLAGRAQHRLLARASVSADAGFSWPAGVPGWACFPIQFTALGRAWTPLVGNVVTPIQRLLHVKLAARPTARPVTSQLHVGAATPSQNAAREHLG